MPVELRVNGELVEIEAEPDTPLLWALRERLGLTGTKFGCGVGLCGACTVHLDGAAARACITPLSSARGRAVTTIEGLGQGTLHPVQAAWLAEQVPQCGYCQPGQMMGAAALLARNPSPDDAEIAAVMSTHLCRCGTYPRIERAMRRLRKSS